MGDPNDSPPAPACLPCAHSTSLADSAHRLYLSTLSERDHYRQLYNALRDELRSVRRELNAAREERDINERRAARAVQERDAWIDLSDEVKASLAEITGMAVAL